MQAKIPGSEFHIIPDAAHMSAVENPAEVNRRILEFLRKL
jgi:pimeloyl-ACP methyl ester carboxylesterase